MNLVVERASALSAIARVIGVVERRNTIAILGNVALTAEGDRLSLRATDLEMEAIESFPAEVGTAGEITIAADKLHDIVRNSDTGAQIKVAFDPSDPRVKVRSGRSNFSLPALPASDFPRFNTDGLGDEFALPAKTLASMLSRVKWMADAANSTDVKGGVYLATVDGQLHAVAASGFGAVLCREPAPDGARLAAVLPMKLVNQLIRWLTDAEGDVFVSAADWEPGDRSAGWELQKKIRVRHESGQITSNLFDAPSFVNYRGVMIDSHELTAITDQDALSLAIRRVLIMQDAKAGAIRMTLSNGSISVQARNDQSGEGNEEISAEYEGPDVTVLLKPSMIQETLGALRGDRVKLAFAPVAREGDALSVKVLIEAPADSSFTATLAQPRA